MTDEMQFSGARRQDGKVVLVGPGIRAIHDGVTAAGFRWPWAAPDVILGDCRGMIAWPFIRGLSTGAAHEGMAMIVMRDDEGVVWHIWQHAWTRVASELVQAPIAAGIPSKWHYGLAGLVSLGMNCGVTWWGLQADEISAAQNYTDRLNKAMELRDRRPRWSPVTDLDGALLQMRRAVIERAVRIPSAVQGEISASEAANEKKPSPAVICLAMATQLFEYEALQADKATNAPRWQFPGVPRDLVITG